MSDNPNSIVIEDDIPEAAPAPAKNEAPAVQQPAPEPEAAPEKVKRGTNYVDFDSLPKEIADVIEPRFKRLYGNLKAVERDKQALFEANQRLIERMESLEQQTATKQTTDQMAELRNAYAQAQMSADYNRAAEILEQMADLKAAAKENKVRIAPPKPTEPELDLSQQEQAAVVAWAAQTDEDGQPLRPWANPAHPKFARFQGALRGVTDDPDFTGAALSKILGEVDRMMGAPTQARGAAAVLTSSPESAIKAPRAVALTDQEKRVAQKMFRDTGIAKTDEDAHNLFRRNKSATSSNRFVVED